VKESKQMSNQTLKKVS